MFTTLPDRGETETLRVSYNDGLFVAGKKMMSVEEHEQEMQALKDALMPPICAEQGTDKLLYYVTGWRCVCKSSYYGRSCEFPVLACEASSVDEQAWMGTDLQHLTPESSGGGFFGNSISMSSTHIAVGAYGWESSESCPVQIYAYDSETHLYTLRQTIQSPDNTSRCRDFGTSVAISSEHLAITAPVSNITYIYSFDSGTGEFTLSQELKISHGVFCAEVSSNGGSCLGDFSTVALDSKHLLLGSFNRNEANPAGVVHVYSYDADTNNDYMHTQDITAHDSDNSADFFGWTVEVMCATLVVGAPQSGDSNSGAVYLYSISPLTSSINHTQKLTNPTADVDIHYFGNLIALSETHLAVGTRSEVVLIYLLDPSKAHATFARALTAPSDSALRYPYYAWFGRSLSWSHSFLAVGAAGFDRWRGAVYIYEADSDMTYYVAKIDNPHPTQYTWFGSMVKLNSKNLAVASMQHYDSGWKGAVYVYNSTTYNLL
eukprot:gene23836-28906_t